jgi:hypothetical protein
VIRCECGWECRTESREAAAALMRRHLAAEHSGLSGVPTPADLLAMAEEE